MTFIQILVGLSLGSLLLLAAMQGYFQTRVGFQRQQNRIHQLDAGRMALQYLSRDIQASGYRGCRSRDKAFPFYRHDSELHSSYGFLRFDRAVFGFFAKAGVCYGLLPDSSCKRLKRDSSVLVLYNIAQPIHRLKKPLTDTQSPIETSGKATVQKNALVLIADCQQADLFIANRLDKHQIFHEKILGVNRSEHLSKAYGIDAEILELQTVAYYVGVPERFSQKKIRNPPYYSLFRDDFLHQAMEVVTHIEALELSYGLPHPETGKLHYQPAGALKENDWPLVQSIRITLVSQDKKTWKIEIAIRNRLHPATSAGDHGDDLAYGDASAVAKSIALYPGATLSDSSETKRRS